MYNITKNLNNYGGRNKWSIFIGNTRNSIGSSNRIYQYCRKKTPYPLYCMFQIPSIIYGILNFSFIYNGIDPLTINLIANNLPIIVLPKTFEIKPIIIIKNNNVNVTIKTRLYETSPFYNNDNVDYGITFNDVNSNSSASEFYNNNTTNLIINYGYNCPFSRYGFQFSGLQELTILNKFIPYILPNTLFKSCFYSCVFFNSDISNWNTSNVTDMNSMFLSSGFNNGDPYGESTKPLEWNTSNVTNMANMFQNNDSFNQYIGNWDTSKVTDMSLMFNEAKSFNKDIGNWNTSNVINMYRMFYNANKFNQYIGNWNLSKTNNLSGMFESASDFNNGDTQKLSNKPLKWKTNNVDDMQYMFLNATSFNQNISYDVTNGYWNTNKVTYMIDMFNSASSFNNGQGPGETSQPLLWLTDGLINNNYPQPGFNYNSNLTRDNTKTSNGNYLGS